MTRLRIILPAVIFMLVISYVPGNVAMAAGTDVIKEYAIDILPQADGSLVNTYAIHWCVISDAAGPLTWFTVGMPAEQYQVVSYSGDVTSVMPNNSGFDYQIRVNLPREVNAGDCVNVTVQIHQYGLAYQDETSGEVSFQFTPGWFNDIPVDHLLVTWHLPPDSTQVRSLNPEPTSQNESQAVWESDLRPGEKYPITVVYDKAAFPDLNTGPVDLPSPTTSSPSGFGNATPSSDTNEDTDVPLLQPSGWLPSLSLTSCLCLCMIMILVLVILFVIFKTIGSVGRIYRGGGYLGGYTSRRNWPGGGGGSSGWGSGTSNRRGGGSGLFGGRGMSCACVSSGCACACAGGGRAGCSRKGFDVSGLFQDRMEEKNP